MNKKLLIIILAVLAIGVGVWIYTQQPTPAVPNPSTNPALSSETNNESAPSAPQGSVKEFTITGQNFSFTPSSLTVNKGDHVKITFKNSDGFHDFKIDEFSVATPRVQAGQEATVEFDANKTGSFEYYCSVGNHRAMGMKGTLVVQ